MWYCIVGGLQPTNNFLLKLLFLAQCVYSKYNGLLACMSLKQILFLVDWNQPVCLRLGILYNFVIIRIKLYLYYKGEGDFC